MMTKKSSNKQVRNSDENLKHFQIRIISAMILITFVALFLLTVIMIHQTRTSVKKKFVTLISANSQQLELNIDNYLEKVERNATLLFADENYFLYDETDEQLDDYAKIQKENEIQARIVDLGLMDNYADFSIIYADNRTIGWMSTVTLTMFPGRGLYRGFTDYLKDDALEAWVFGVDGNIDRLFYIRRLNPNAVLIVSFYNHELEYVFEYPDELQDMTIRLVDDTCNILFSSERSEIGEKLDQELITVMGDNAQFSATTREQLITANSCENGWRVVCTIPTDVIFAEINNMYIYILFTAFVISIAVTIVVVVSSRHLTRPVDQIVNELTEQATIDNLSGVLNKAAFYQEVGEQIKAGSDTSVHLFCMLDADNFKQINDNFGHAHGDEVIRRMGILIANVAPSNVVVGRLGGDEFAIYERAEQNEEIASKRMKARMEYLFVEFADEFIKENEAFHFSLSCGMRIKQGMTTFEEMYHKADKALYQAKHLGKARLVVFDESQEETENEEA